MKTIIRSLRLLKSFPACIVFILLFSFFGYCVVSASRATNATISSQQDNPSQNKPRKYGRKSDCPRCAPPGDHEIYIPLIDLPEAKGGELVFNSRSPKEMEVTPTFYKEDGTTIKADPVVIKSSEIRYVNIKDLIPAEWRKTKSWGGLSLSYHGVPREMWAQFRFLNVNSGNSVDEFFTVKAEERSDTQEAVWWMPMKSTAVIALGNITAKPTSAVVTFADGDVRVVNLAPHATEVLRFKSKKRQGAESVVIKITGEPGSIIPTGVITAPDGSFNSVVRFYDTPKAKQPHLFANGLRLSNITPHLVLKNTSFAAVIATPEFTKLSPESDGKIVLPQISLGPGDMVEVDLAPVLAALKKDDFGVVSAKVTNNGTPGSLIGAVYGTHNKTGLNYETPLRDSGPPRAMTGSYPWKVGGDYTTLVYITNITEEPREFSGEINYSGGNFFIGPHKLSPGETKVFDLREIQATQLADSAGKRLPKEISQGQFKWSVRGDTQGRQVLIGRAEMVSKAEEISTSYSCNDPCPPYYGGDISPFSPPVVIVGNAGSSSAWETMYYDWGLTVGPYAVGATWTVDNPVGTIDPVSAHETDLTGTTPGGATLDGFIATQPDYVYDGRDCYYLGTYDEGGQTPVAVVNVEKIQYKRNGTWTDMPTGGLSAICNGSSIQFRAVATGGAAWPSGQPTWGGDASGTGEEKTVTFSSSGSRTVSVTSSNTVSTTIVVGATNSTVSITWPSASVTTNGSSTDATTTAAAFTMAYSACGDVNNNLWRLRVTTITGGVNTTITTGGYRNPDSSPPINQSEAQDAVNVMKAYFANGFRGTWHTATATQAHEAYHYTEWQCSAGHYWTATETAIENLTVAWTSQNSENDAITALRGGGGGADAKVTAFFNASNTYFLALDDNAGSRPYAAGQLALNPSIVAVQNLAATHSWTVPSGTNSPSTANPCFKTFPSFTP